MEITINIKSLKEEIEMVSSFIGRRSVDQDGNSMYDKVKITEQDYPLIEEYIYSGIDRLTSLLSDFFDNKETTEDNCIIFLSVPDSFNDSFEQPIEAHSNSFIKNIVLQEWLQLNYEVASPIYAVKALDEIKEVKKLFYKRTQPIKRKWK